MINSKKQNRFIPGLRYSCLTPFYDSITKLVMPEITMKQSLVEQANIQKGYRILDIGCGTATLTMLIKRSQPESVVFGLDGDLQILKKARDKIFRAELDIGLVKGLSTDLPFADNFFDRVFCSLILHHLTQENKTKTLKEASRILYHFGELHILDFAEPTNPVMAMISLYMRHSERTYELIKGFLPKMLNGAGFIDIKKTRSFSTILGTISLFSAKKPR